jgi:RNA polymerase-interacting CarD/CdnL/TRCF family regulator
VIPATGQIIRTLHGIGRVTGVERREIDGSEIDLLAVELPPVRQ